MNTPRIALIQGDIAGIGPELTIKLLADKSLQEVAKFVVIGAPEAFQRGEETTKTPTPVRHHKALNQNIWEHEEVAHVDLDIPNIASVPMGKTTAEAGKSSLLGLELALKAYQDNLVDGICFLPFNKHSMHLGGNRHTDEMGFCRSYLHYEGRVSEFNVVDGIWNGRVTSHVALKDVPALVTEDRVLESIQLADRTLKQAEYAKPRIAVTGLNPHSGDGGLLGMEEIDHIIPAIKTAQQDGVEVQGPFPGDTVYLKARAGEFDAVVTMYHDQGQVAIKMMGFDRGVSVLGGLPVPITTPAHGTAFDIAGKNIANVIPSRNAVGMVAKMATQD